MLLQIDPLLKAPGIKHPGAKFDTRQQAALRMGDYKIVTGPSVLGGWYKPESVECESKSILLIRCDISLFFSKIDFRIFITLLTARMIVNG